MSVLNNQIVSYGASFLGSINALNLSALPFLGVVKSVAGDKLDVIKDVDITNLLGVNSVISFILYLLVCIYYGAKIYNYIQNSIEERRTKRIDNDVKQLDLDIKINHPGPGGIFKGSPWRISRRAPHIGEHTNEILANDLKMSEEEIYRLSENKIV